MSYSVYSLCKLSQYSSVLGSITRFQNMAYHVGETSHKPFSCLFTANPKPTAELHLDDMTVAGTHVRSTNKYEYNISLSIRELKLKTAGLYRCLVSFSGSPLNLTRTAPLQGGQIVTLIFGIMGLNCLLF